MSGFGSRAFIHRRAAADEIRRIVSEPVQAESAHERAVREETLGALRHALQGASPAAHRGRFIGSQANS